MTDQSPRDALARRIAIKMDATLASDDVWQANADMVANHLAEPNWGAWLPYRKAYAMADLVLAWLAEPEQIEAMAIGYFNSGETDEWTDWNSVDGSDFQDAVRDRQSAAVAALRGKP